MSGVLKYTIVRRHPETLQAVALIEGTEVPDWAADMVEDDDLTTGGDAGGEGAYSGREWSKSKLEAEVKARNADRDAADHVQVAEPGNKPELIAALEQDDADHPA